MHTALNQNLIKGYDVYLKNEFHFSEVYRSVSYSGSVNFASDPMKLRL